jgi:glucan phosphorylase
VPALTASIPRLIRTYLSHYAVDELDVSVDDLLAMGRQNPEDDSEPFNMAYLAVRGSGQINGVSKLHGKVSRQIFQTLFPSWPQEEVPIGSVTNGIHVPTWDSAEADALWTSACGVKRWRGDRPSEDDIRQILNRCGCGNCAQSGRTKRPDRADAQAECNVSSPRKARIRRMLPAFSMRMC